MTKINRFLPWAFMVLMALCAAYFMVSENSDMLFMAQERATFHGDNNYFKELMNVPGGLIAWVGAYLTQTFYHPELGSAIIIALWCLLFWAVKAAFRIGNAISALATVPSLCMLCSIIGMGYWIYYIKMPGYYFAETLGFIIVAMFVICNRLTNNQWVRIAVTIVAALCYPLFGFYSILALIVCALTDIKDLRGNIAKLNITATTAVALIIAVPILASNSYTELPLSRMWTASLPVFQMDNDEYSITALPIMISIIAYIIYPFLPSAKELDGWKSKMAIAGQVVFIALAAYLINSWNFDNYNFHAETRMYRAIDEGRWEDALTEAGNAPGNVTRQIVLMRNIALLNTGKAGYQMFHYNNMGEPPYVRDSLRIHMVQTGAPLIYFHYGKTNYSLRWSIENAVEYDYSFNSLKMLALTSLIHGEYQAAKRYLDVLSTTMFYKDWAARYIPILNDHSLLHGEKLKQHYPELANVIELRDHMGSTLDGDNGLCEMYIINYFANTMNKDSKLLQECTLMYSLIQKDIKLFWPRFFLYAELHNDEQMPIHYQEAAYLYGMLEPQTMDISRMPFNKEKVVDRYNGFNQMTQNMLATGMNTEQVAEATRSTYGDTFWWFYFFCRDVHSY